ncbi:MAG: haloacid dehalogenase-like hydrolase [Candidatus Riflebacteria bacterium]|nr:haloacid dehalogenase-like hydrolase [Candidatus Riflebacteria bacterium]
MTTHIFPQTVIAMIWDFDKTLIPGYMQAPLFEHYGVDGNEFWAEVGKLEETYRQGDRCLVSRDTLYLNHILAYVKAGVFKGLCNRMLREFGTKLTFYDGLPGFFEEMKELVRADQTFAKHGVTVEHYIVSTGLRQMILGSAIARHADGVWGCEYVGDVPGPGFLKTPPAKLPSPDSEFTDIAYAVDHTSKTRAIFEVNKGTNKHREIEVNASIAREHRRVPFENMIYIADGPSDISVFSMLNQNGAKTFAVYRPGSQREFEQVYRLQQSKRVQSFGEANYTTTSQTHMWLATSVRDIARRVVREKERAVGEQTGAVPGHFNE